jgi:hypothetical protein
MLFAAAPIFQVCMNKNAVSFKILFIKSICLLVKRTKENKNARYISPITSCVKSVLKSSSDFFSKQIIDPSEV